MTAPFIVGDPVAFDSTQSTPFATFADALAGDWVALFMCVANNYPSALTMGDTLGGNSLSYPTEAEGGTEPNRSAWRRRKITASGEFTVGLGKDGGALYCGLAYLVRGVHATSEKDGADVAAHYIDGGLNSITPADTSFPDTLILGGLACTQAGYATGFTFSDTPTPSGGNNNATVGRQVQVQKRIAAAGTQATMTFSYSGGVSGSDLRSNASLISFRAAVASGRVKPWVPQLLGGARSLSGGMS